MALGIFLACPSAFSLNPSLNINQYAHTSWKIRDGFPKGEVRSITQTPDGYIWLGTEFGLVRFDGVKSTPWPSDKALPSNAIMSLLTARDGTLWIGTNAGLASWKDGKLNQHAELAGQIVMRLLEDREGVIWAAGYRVPTGRLCAMRNGNVRCYGQDGRLGHGVFGLFQDRKNNLWAGVAEGLWKWEPDSPTFYPMPAEIDGVQGFADGDEGELLIGGHEGIRYFVEGKAKPFVPAGARMKLDTDEILRDRHGGLWIGTRGQGLVHVYQGRADVFTQSDGLSSDRASSLFEDREGNIWVATSEGLDRFREFAIATISVKNGLSSATVGSVLAARDGSVWIGTRDGLNKWKDGRMTVYRAQHRPASPAGADQQAAVREITASGLPNINIESLFQDSRGRIWVSTLGGLGYFEDDRFTSISGAAVGVNDFAEDRSGNLWLTDLKLGLVRLSPDHELQTIALAELGPNNVPLALLADPLQGLWIGFRDSGIVHFADGKIRSSYGAAEGLTGGRVKNLWFDREDTLWAATDGGLSRVKSGRAVTLSSKNGLPCDAVHWAMEDGDRSFWLFMTCGLVRISRSDLDAWAAGAGNGDHANRIEAQVFDVSDGVISRASIGSFHPHASRSADGKLWFAASDGVSLIDPRSLGINNVPPPVHIEKVTADRKPYELPTGPNGHLRLPPLVRDLVIDYTALSLAAPEKVRFRYKLEGRDTDWHDVDSRRQAFYEDLPPRNYRFRVIASNNSGVWNETGASLDFSVDPMYYQTTWFQLSCVGGILAILGGIYQLRLQQVRRQFNMRLDERVSERTRIARDLHDTLLQSFQGVLLKFNAVSYMIHDRPAEAQQALEGAIEQARNAIVEGRDAVQGLRSATGVTTDLARVIGMFGEELVADHGGKVPPVFRLDVEGAPRDLVPILRDEVYRIACEALRNAFRHSHGYRIEVEIRYDRRQLRLRVRDNGDGIDPKVLDTGSREGHHGLPGMHERAKLVGGRLAIWSELDSGTEIELTIPAAVAYAKSSAPRGLAASGDGSQ